MKRPVDLLVLSDVHLGYQGCRAEELLAYLKTIQPARVVLLGDIIDIWQFRTSYWPEAHLKVVRRLLKYAQQGIPVHYVIGNHDEALRRYAPLILGEIRLVDELELELAGQRTWFIHGDRFDALLATPRWMSFLGTIAYDSIAWGTCWLNRLRRALGRSRVAPAEFFKRSLPSANRHIRRFETIAAGVAHDHGYDAVVCGHIHAPEDRRFPFDDAVMHYLNSGDWVESCTALEHHEGRWRLHHARTDHSALEEALDDTVPGEHLLEPALAMMGAAMALEPAGLR